jgi:hypothetical protein
LEIFIRRPIERTAMTRWRRERSQELPASSLLDGMRIVVVDDDP